MDRRAAPGEKARGQSGDPKSHRNHGVASAWPSRGHGQCLCVPGLGPFGAPPHRSDPCYRGRHGRTLALATAGDQSLNRLKMKSLTEYLYFEVPDRRGFVNITETVADLVRKSRVEEGLCLVNAMHITASVFINDAES